MKKQRTSKLVIGFVLIIVSLIFSCTKHESPRNSVGFAGVYTLKSVNGEPVPTNVTHEGASLKVHSGTFTINANGKCSSKTVFVPPIGTEIVREAIASYIMEGSNMTMQWEDAGKTIGTIKGNTFTMDNEGMMFVYIK